MADLIDRSVSSSNDAKYVAQVAAHHKTHWTAGFLMMIGGMLFLGAVVGIAHLVRTRKPALANVAGPLAAVGVLAFQGWAVISMGVDTALARNPNRAAMVSLYHDASNSADLAPNIILMMVMMLAVIALAFGLWRGKLVSRWIAAAVGLSMVALFASGNALSGMLVAHALFIIGFAGVGLSVLSRTDEEWETGALPASAPKTVEAPAPASA